MKPEDDILNEAIEQFRNEQIPSHPPQEVFDATVKKMTAAAEAAGPAMEVQNVHRIRLITKLAAAAAVLVFAGYAIGRLSAPRPPDLQQLQKALETSLAAAIEPSVRQKVVEDLGRQWESTLEAGYLALREDLTEQYHTDLLQVAAQTLAVSNATTHRLLEDLIASIRVAQVQNRQWVAAALAEIDSTRRQDSTQFATALLSLAVATEDQLERTRKDMVNMLAETRDHSPLLDQHDSTTK
ncbi:hypothetical protein [Anaerobaca lacustris]|uniref:Uncharacterized protein n=1 Tax=Anaerobaca lacustris TaxID=3044600 RepID=A0AAW6TYD9_9BACT|nr:hypothetical protein [Sedimentisphaerales bacterium M17dextr]